MDLFLPGNARRWASYDLEVAEKLGLNEAIVLAQIISSIEGHIDRGEKERFFRDGRWWMYDSMPALCRNTALGMDAVRRTLNRLKKLEIISTFQYELAEGLARFWYAINTESLTKVLALSPPMCAKPQDGGACVQNHRVAPPPMCAKPQGAMCAKPQDLSITLNSITLNPITLNIGPSIAPIIALDIKKPRAKKQKPPMTPEEFSLGQAWHEYAKANLKTKPYPSWNDGYFTEALMKVMKSTGTSIQGMNEILTFLKGDEFWKPNGISPASLLNISKTNQKRKIDNILDAMDRAKKGGIRYERLKAVDLSADNGKFANCNDNQPWST